MADAIVERYEAICTNAQTSIRAVLRAARGTPEELDEYMSTRRISPLHLVAQKLLAGYAHHLTTRTAVREDKGIGMAQMDHIIPSIQCNATLMPELLHHTRAE